MRARQVRAARQRQEPTLGDSLFFELSELALPIRVQRWCLLSRAVMHLLVSALVMRARQVRAAKQRQDPTLRDSLFFELSGLALSVRVQRWCLLARAVMHLLVCALVMRAHQVRAARQRQDPTLGDSLFFELSGLASPV